MNMLYPLKFRTIEKRALWGTELWLLSALEDDETEVIEGYLSDNTPNELAEIYMGEVMGDKVYGRYGAEFPLLFKRIIAKERLSLQVHPNSELAAERHNAYGKNELWYVNSAESGSSLILGFKEDVTPEKYLAALANGTLEELCNVVEVTAGDMFYIPAGLVHSIGGGITITEVQQSSDITYRIFDWNRLDSNGESRELHTELATDAIDFGASATNLRRALNNNELITINTNEYFTTEMVECKDSFAIESNGGESFIALIALQGGGDIEYDMDGVVGFDEGDIAIIPAEIEDAKIYGDIKILKVEIRG